MQKLSGVSPIKRSGFSTARAPVARSLFRGSRESAKVVGLVAQRDPCPGLVAQHRQNSVARRSEHLDARSGRQRLRICARRPFSHDLHVELHRVGVRMHLNHGDLGTTLVGILVERAETGLVRLDEVTKFRNAPLFVLELALLELVRGDEDEWPWHNRLLEFGIGWIGEVDLPSSW